MKIGVIVGRFQTDQLTQGHLELVREAQKTGCRKVLFLIGSVGKPPSHNNPLSFDQRMRMIIASLGPRPAGADSEFSWQQFPGMDFGCLPIYDRGSNREWVANLDRGIEAFFAEDEIILFAGRDSGVNKVYKLNGGKFPVVEVKEHPDSATKRREDIGRNGWRLDLPTIIWTTQQQYPKVYPTVDCVLRDKAGFIVLIRKRGEPLWRFPGGFVDPADASFDAACRREVAEECKVEITDPRYVASIKVDDWRYRNEKDKIITTLFAADVMFGRLEAGDDAGELLSFASDSVETNLVEEHKPLWEAYKDWLTRRR